MTTSEKPPRPSASDLLPVADDDWLLRRIQTDAYDFAGPEGKFLRPALFPSDDFRPSEDSYGASVFVESRLPEGLATLIKADSSWQACGVVRVPVCDLKQRFKLTICFTPPDCDYEDETLRVAHASIIGIGDRKNRNAMVDYLQAYVYRAPTRGGD